MHGPADPVVAIDIGGTSLKGARVSPDGRILARARVATPVRKGSGAVLDALAALVETLSTRRHPAAIGLGVPGAVLPREGLVLSSPNLPCWVDYPIGPLLSDRLRGMPVHIDNDANAAALGEAWLGSGRDVENLVLVTLGTGVGGGIVLGGRVWRGDAGRAGELGHTVVHPGGRRCGCGARGCLEAYAGAGALVRAATEAYGSSPGATRSAWTPRSLAVAARRDDRIAAAVWRSAGRALGLAIVSWIQVLDVRTLVVGGGVSGALDLLEPHVRREIRGRLWGMDADSVRIARATLGRDAGMIGAARLALEAGAR